MRRSPALRGLIGWLLALYLGVGLGAPLADAALYHLGGAQAPVRPSVDDGRSTAGLHNLCLLGQHARETITPAVVSLPPAITRSIDHSRGVTATLPREATATRLPLPRAPPRV